MSDYSCRAITMSTSAESLYTKLKLKTPGSGPAAWRSTTGQYFCCAEWDSGEWTCSKEYSSTRVPQVSIFLARSETPGIELKHGGVPQVGIFLARNETPGSGPAAWRRYHRSVFFLRGVTPESGPEARRSTTGQYFFAQSETPGRGPAACRSTHHRSVFFLRGVRLQGVDLKHGGDTIGQYFSCAEWDSDEPTLCILRRRVTRHLTQFNETGSRNEYFLSFQIFRLPMKADI